MKKEFEKIFGMIEPMSLRMGLYEVFEKGWMGAIKKHISPNKEEFTICFKCKKCDRHHLYVPYGTKPRECPNCGEEPEENWIFIGYGDLGDFE